MKKVLLIVIVIFIALALFFSNKLYRIYRVLTLFDQEQMAENFTELKDIFPTKKMTKSTSPLHLEEELNPNLLDFDIPQLKQSCDSFLNKTNTSGLLVIQKEKVIYSYFNNHLTPESYHISWSMSKSVISFLIGKAYRDGLIESLQDPVEKYAPVLAKSNYKGVTLKNVLQMSSGIRFDEDYKKFNSDINKMGRVFALGTSFEKYILGMQRERPQGTFNQYVSMDTQVLGMVLEGATGESITDYGQRELWHPMGAENDAYWIIDSKEMEAAFGGLNATIYDYAKLGILYANYGKINNQTLIDSTWIGESWNITEPHLMPGENDLSNTIFGYGYQWWIPDWPASFYEAQGIYGQYIVVDPKNDIVIVKLSGNQWFKDHKVETQVEHNIFFKEIINHLTQ